MPKFNKIPQDTFNDLVLGAGTLLWSFHPESPTEPTDEQVICATSGGIKPSCKPSIKDMGSDIDNCPKNTADLAFIESWECKLSTTAVGVSAKIIQLALGAADIDDSKITPRMKLKIADFKDIWWVGERGDGGMAAIHLKNALSTDGFELTTVDKEKGKVALNLTGFTKIETQDEVPMEFFVSSDNAA